MKTNRIEMETLTSKYSLEIKHRYERLDFCFKIANDRLYIYLIGDDYVYDRASTKRLEGDMKEIVDGKFEPTDKSLDEIFAEGIVNTRLV